MVSWCATGWAGSSVRRANAQIMSIRSIQHGIEYLAVRGAMATAGALPLPAAQRLGAGAGSLAFDLFRVRRDVTVANIERALGVSRADAVGIGRRAYRNLGRSLFEFAAFARFTPEEVRDLVTLEGMEHLRAVHAHGRGAVFVTGHHGSWELMGAVMAANGFPVDYLVGRAEQQRAWTR